jgi:Catalase
MSTENNPNDPQDPVFEEVLRNTLADQEKHGPHLRQLHAKSHGLVTGKFIVEANIPKECKVGVFATPKDYDILIRFSNSSPAKPVDQLFPDIPPNAVKGDGRGMAIKLLDVDGDTFLSQDESRTQDFVLLNHPVFFAKDAKGYLDFRKLRLALESIEQKKLPRLLGLLLNPQALLLLLQLGPNLKVQKAIAARKTGNPLLITYWSTTPYKLGSHSIKFAVRPHAPELPPSTIPASPDYLREAMVQHLQVQKQPAGFDFLVQFFVDDDKTPIENAMQEWLEKDAPFIKVATVLIPPQEFDTPERKQQDASLLFTPWHGLPDHEPLGNINLSRRRIYAEGANARRSRS